MIESDIDQHVLELEREYLQFLDDSTLDSFHYNRVKEMIEHKRQRLIVSMFVLRERKPDRAEMLIKNCAEEQLAMQNALKQLVLNIDPTYNRAEFYVGFEGTFGDHHVTPRTLTSKFMNGLVCLEGIVTQCSVIRPKLMRSVHFCPATKKTSERHYSDFTSLKPAYTTPVYPRRDIDGNLLKTEYGLSSFKDHQTLTIQEMPERAPPGQLPRSVEVICDDDLADRCKPGDRVQIIGLYRCLPTKKGGYTNCIFRTIMLANNISLLSKDAKLNVSRNDIANCRELAKRSDIFDFLSRSIAPSIHGNDYVKKAILCMLLGGVERILKNGTRLRGDINILLIGDPSVAKSQMLRYVLCSAPRAIATTGRGSSGVGLTAAVTSDRETGERRLEAGAMVLADRGIVCIDEFDKMTDIDRTAIHEVMEQGRITISKAGIHAQLNARCSVLAAANPVYGKYDQYKPPMQNIGLQDSLLTRFDLLFVMLDNVDTDIDTIISDHVVRMHRYRTPGETDGSVLPLTCSVDILRTEETSEKADEKPGTAADVPMFQKHDELLHGKTYAENDQIFTVEFMRVYINFAKTFSPTLGDEAAEVIAEEYARLRSQDAVQDGEARTQRVTVRTLETLIRLASAHAKCRLSATVDLEDAEAAIELVQFSYFKKVLTKTKEKEKKRRRKGLSSGGNDSEDDDNDTSNRRKKPRRPDATVNNDEDALGSTMDVDTPATGEDAQEPSSEQLSHAGEISDERYEEFRLLVSRIFQEQNVQSLNYDKLMTVITEKTVASPYSGGEIQAALNKMIEDNKVMLADKIVFLI